MNKQFVNSVEKVCIKSLKKKGFVSPRSRTRFIRLNDEFLGWVGLNRGNYSDHLQINPFIGVHCIPVMRLIVELKNERYKEGELASYAIHMGEIAPDLRHYIFTDDTNHEAEADRLAGEIITHALPWMKNLASYDALTPLLKDNIEMLGGYPERYASALYFSGQKEKARKFVTERTDLFDPNYVGPYSLFEKFGEPFLVKLASEGDVKRN